MLSIIQYVMSKLNADATNGNAPSEREIRRSISQLYSMNDRELGELGLSRGGIEYAVRHGRSQDDLDKAA